MDSNGIRINQGSGRPLHGQGRESSKWIMAEQQELRGWGELLINQQRRRWT